MSQKAEMQGCLDGVETPTRCKNAIGQQIEVSSAVREMMLQQPLNIFNLMKFEVAV